MNVINNNRNSSGHKDQGDCYRQGGKYTQWVDEGAIGTPEFDSVLQGIIANGTGYKVIRRDDGRRLFVKR